MRSPRRAVASLAAVVLSAALLAIPAAPARAAGPPTTLAATPATPRHLSTSYVAPRAARSGWPVGSRTGDLRPEEGVTPSGDPSQNLTSVRVAQHRAASTIQADIKLAAEPTAATNSRLRVAFGKVVEQDDGSAICTPTQKSYVDINSFDVDGTGTKGNPAYDGRKVTVKPFRLGIAKDAAWNCAYALMLSMDGTVLYDAFIGGLVEHRQKPRLSIVVQNKKLRRTGWTRVPIKIHNSATTIAAAPAVRLVWRTRGVAVRATHGVGGIKPGRSRRSAFYVRDTRPGNGVLVFTAISKSYRTSLRLVVRELG